MPFMERMVADCRSIGLYHTSGLSTPQQIFMDIMALTHLICENDDPYITLSKQLVNERHEALFHALGLEPDTDRDDANYYDMINLNEIAEKHYTKEFSDWLSENVDELTFLNDLAARYENVSTN